jgi:hypothetical protein
MGPWFVDAEGNVIGTTSSTAQFYWRLRWSTEEDGSGGYRAVERTLISDLRAARDF